MCPRHNAAYARADRARLKGKVSRSVAMIVPAMVNRMRWQDDWKIDGEGVARHFRVQ
jgi:hypothetical protein